MGRLRRNASHWPRPDHKLDNAIFIALRAVWIYERHCLYLGCGQDTLAWWVHKVTGLWFHPSDIRRTLLAAHRDGRVKMILTNGSCTKFLFTWSKSSQESH